MHFNKQNLKYSSVNIITSQRITFYTYTHTHQVKRNTHAHQLVSYHSLKYPLLFMNYQYSLKNSLWLWSLSSSTPPPTPPLFPLTPCLALTPLHPIRHLFSPLSIHITTETSTTVTWHASKCCARYSNSTQVTSSTFPVCDRGHAYIHITITIQNQRIPPNQHEHLDFSGLLFSRCFFFFWGGGGQCWYYNL